MALSATFGGFPRAAVPHLKSPCVMLVTQKYVIVPLSSRWGASVAAAPRLATV